MATPQQVTERLTDIYSHPYKLERTLLYTYYVWLGCVTAILWLTPMTIPHSVQFAKTLWRHIMLNIASLTVVALGDSSTSFSTDDNHPLW
mmetsp:Transcript_28599/g.23673  ORF Transcript_28599/g.23673 Transcript_28599/m.23673 type:complete len:90 (-) Transcript_28599:125-394(-)